VEENQKEKVKEKKANKKVIAVIDLAEAGKKVNQTEGN
jgi:hypothetical protein